MQFISKFSRLIRLGIPRCNCNQSWDPARHLQSPKPPKPRKVSKKVSRQEFGVLSICKNRLCAVSAKDGRTSKTRGGRCSIDRYAVFLLHSCPWSLEPNRASNDIIMLSTSRSRLQAASLDTPPSIACCVSIHIEKSKLGFPTHISQSQLNSARFLASKDHNVAIDLVL